MDADTIVAGLLHDTVEDTELTLDDISFHFGPEVMEIVRGDSKMSKLCGEAAALPADERKELNHRNMLLAMGDDWRIVVVKLADRLHNMRTLEHMPRHKQVAIARETLQIFVPLARRLGIETLERELTDISVEYIFPEELKGVFGLELLGHWADPLLGRARRAAAARHGALPSRMWTPSSTTTASGGPSTPTTGPSPSPSEHAVASFVCPWNDFLCFVLSCRRQVLRRVRSA